MFSLAVGLRLSKHQKYGIVYLVLFINKINMKINKKTWFYVVVGVLAAGTIGLASVSLNGGLFQGMIGQNQTASQQFLANSQSCFAFQKFFPPTNDGKLIAATAQSCRAKVLNRLTVDVLTKGVEYKNAKLLINGQSVELKEKPMNLKLTQDLQTQKLTFQLLKTRELKTNDVIEVTGDYALQPVAGDTVFEVSETSTSTSTTDTTGNENLMYYKLMK